MTYDLTKSMYDYQQVLRDACIKIKPQRVLEWGPGYSTHLIHETCPKAEIISIEHQDLWYEKAAKEMPFAQIIFVPNKDLDTDQYPAYPIKYELGMFDLVFVDGISRNACLITAALILQAKGMILLHDAKSAKYQPGIQTLKKLKFGFKRINRTGVFSRC